MNQFKSVAFPSGLEDPELVDVVAEVADRLNSGGRVDLTEYAARCPGREAQLRALVEALCMVEAAGGSDRAPAEEAPISRTLGDFRIIREVGRGGMGVVYEAEQISLGRRVALKVLPFAATMDPKQLQRFHNEARAAASLHHPNIAPVFGVGSERSVHFYAMQFIDGRPLTELVRERRGESDPTAPSADPTGPYVPDTAPVAQTTAPSIRGDAAWYRHVADLGIQAAEALEYAHSVGIVHRDIKPGNLLLDGLGRLWVTDFGLAKHGDVNLTMSGDLLGTLRYMSPEQAMARHGLVDHRTDIYSLGATLYELLTGRPVVPGEDKQELLRRIAFEDPAAPRKLDPKLPHDLETIVLKALEKNPGDRYGSANDVADDLKRWLEHRVVKAHPPSLARRLTKWARRHRGLTYAAIGSLVALLITLTAGTAIVAAAYRAEAKQRHTAERQRARAEENFENALGMFDRLSKGLDDPKLKNVREMEVVRESLYAEAIPFYRAFISQGADDPSSQYQAARALGSVGYLESILNRHDEALANLEKAIALAQDLRERFPNDSRYHRCVAEGSVTLSSVYQAKAMPAESDSARRTVIDALEMIPPNQLTDQDINYIADSFELLASSAARDGRPRDAAALLGKGIAYRREDRNPGWTYKNAQVFCTLANMLADADDLEGASEAYWNSLQRWNRIPQDLEIPAGSVAGQMAETYEKLGDVLFLSNKPDDATAAYAQCTAKKNEASRLQGLKKVEKPQHETALFWRRKGASFAQKNRYDAAEKCYEKAIPLMVKEDAEWWSLEWWSSKSLLRFWKFKTTSGEVVNVCEGVESEIGGLWKQLGDGYFVQHEFQKAAHAFQKARDAFRRAIPKSGPFDLPEIAWFFATCPDETFRDATEAIRLAKRAAELQAQLSKSIVILDDASNLWRVVLGIAEYRAGDYRSAHDTLRESTKHEHDHRQTATFFFLAMAHHQLGNYAEARTCYDKAAAWLDESSPDSNGEMRRVGANSFQKKDSPEVIALFRLCAEAAKLLGVTEKK